MMATILEFPIPNNDDHKPIQDTSEKGRVISLNTKAESDDTVTDDIIRKIEAFSKLEMAINQDVYKNYLDGIKDLSLDELIAIASLMTEGEMQSRPAYTKALFTTLSQKIKEVEK